LKNFKGDEKKKICFTQELIFLLPNAYEVLEQHQTINAQLNEDDCMMVNCRLQQNRQRDDRQNYLLGLILIDEYVLCPTITKKNENQLTIFDFLH
jgi:hypothetical protein